MGKLQMIKRADGSESYSSNIPLPMIKDLDWKKADKLLLKVGKVNERKVIVIFNDKDGEDCDN